jgi:hypothetical protein
LQRLSLWLKGWGRVKREVAEGDGAI